MDGTRGVVAILVVVGIAVPGAAQYAMTDPATPVTVDFAGFTGAGFVANPGAGQLDSDNIIVTGLSDGDMNWGGDYTTGDYARGQSSGGVTTGGIYAGDNGGDTFLMFQPGSSDLTPGAIEMRFVNQTGATQDSLAIDYTILTYNDQDRANSIQCQYSTDGSTWTTISPYDYVSPGAQDASPSWQTTTRNGYVLVVNVAAGATFYIRWYTDDDTGGGSRDELGLDDISIRLYSSATPTPTPTPTATATPTPTPTATATPTDTPTPTATATPTDTPTPTATATPTDTPTPTPTATATVGPVAILTGSSLPDAALGQAYSVVLAATGGTPPYTWTMVSGALPQGITLDGTAGTLTGTPTEGGTFTFTLQVADTTGLTATQDFTLRVREIGIPAIGNRGALAFILILLASGVLIVLRRRTI